MKSARRVILRTLAVAAVMGLTIGGSVRLSHADGGLDTGTGGLGYQGNTESIENSSGAGAGGSTDTGTGSDSSYGSDSGARYGTSGPGVDNSTGYGTGTGGSTDTSSGGTWGSGSGGSTGSKSGNDEDSRAPRGSTIGGVTYPDNSSTLGVEGNGYWEK